MEDHVIGFHKGKGFIKRNRSIVRYDNDYEFYWCNGSSYFRFSNDQKKCHICDVPLLMAVTKLESVR